MKDLPTAAAVTDALNFADFPADKDRLLEFASSAGADDSVLDALRALPPPTTGTRTRSCDRWPPPIRSRHPKGRLRRQW